MFLTFLIVMSTLLAFNFADGPSQEGWQIQNDNVMGGVSEGWIEMRSEGLHWEGATRLENNGGFSSIRSPWRDWDLRGATEIRLKCRGMGGPFKLVLNVHEQWWLPSAELNFDVPEEQGEVVLRMEDLVWSQVGSSAHPPVDVRSELGSVLRVGIMKYDGTASPFEMDLASLTFR